MGGRDQVTPIDVLSDDVLLAIFDSYVPRDRFQKTKGAIEAWQSLVHVCRRWRCVVFGSPRRLNLRLLCKPRTRARGSLDVWPALPLVVMGTISSASLDAFVVALEHRDRIYQVDLEIPGVLQWDKVLASMQVPFPALTHLELRCADRRAPVILDIPDTFLGGSASQLQHLTLECIPFPGILNLLLSATHLVELDLSGIPPSGYISPQAMAGCLFMLIRLRTFSLEFLSSRPRPDKESRRPSAVTRTILPNLTDLWFKGASDYLDDLVAWIDAPRLDRLSITFLDQTNFNTPCLVQFISRTPGFEKPNEARVILDFDTEVHLLWTSDQRHSIVFVKVSWEDAHPRVSSIAQVCATCLPPLPTVEILRLGVLPEDRFLDWKDDVENDEWLELLRPFTAVRSLYLFDDFQSNIASALQELVGDRTMEVLPSLQNIFLGTFEPSGTFQEAIGQFVDARRLSDHTIAISVW